MNLLFEYAVPPGITPVPHAENLATARELVNRYGGVAQEVELVATSSLDDPNTPFCRRAVPEKVVVVDTSLDALAEFAADRDAIVQILACSHWHLSDVGRLTHRLYSSEIGPDSPGE